MALFKDPLYEKNGTFQAFLTQTDEKQVTLNYIISELKKRYSLKNYADFCFTDIGAGDGTLTYPIVQFLKKKIKKVDLYCIEPSPLIEILKAKFGCKANYIPCGMEEVVLPKSDFILLSHAMQYIEDRRNFARSIKDALNENGKMLVVGTKPDSLDLRFQRELRPKVRLKMPKKPKENLFEYLEQGGLKITREYHKSTIDLSNALKLNDLGKEVISFCYHRQFSELSERDILKFKELANKLAPEGKLSKTLQFVWVEKN
jgi:2-polyprenyl-3-methyl-5-hydroxy-6-metoxy-1,4-benzoquinol methylase